MRASNGKKNILIYLLIVGLLIYFFFRFGISLLINAAFFLSSGGLSKKTITQQTSPKKGIGIVLEPVLEDMLRATNSAALAISGRANPETRISLYQNKQFADSTVSDLEGIFSFTVELEEEDNELYVQTKDAYTKKKLNSSTYTVTFLSKPPILEVDNAESGKKVYKADYTVSGKTGSEVFIRVNGSSVIVKADGTFSYTFTLSKGDNQIIVEAEDIAGNITKKEFSVNYVE